MPHYSYIYQDYYFYRDDIIELVEEVAREREELRAAKLIKTSFAEDVKNKILGIDRPLRLPRDKPYQLKGTWFNADGTVMVADDVGKV